MFEFEHFDLKLSTEQLELFEKIVINTSPQCIDCYIFRYYNFAKPENLEKEIEQEIKSYAANSENDFIANNITKIIGNIVNDIVNASKYQQALVFLKAYNLSTTFYNDYAWHMDATLKQRASIIENDSSTTNDHLVIAAKQMKYNNIDKMELNYVATLAGPSTLFYSPSANIFSQSPKGHGTIYISDYQYGAIHTVPQNDPENKIRIFLAITPVTLEDILELEKIL